MVMGKHCAARTGVGMSEQFDGVVETVETEPAVHDHAWRRVSSSQASPGRLGTYRCDLCFVSWSM